MREVLLARIHVRSGGEAEAAIELRLRGDLPIIRGRRSITTIGQCASGARQAWDAVPAQLKAVELAPND